MSKEEGWYTDYCSDQIGDSLGSKCGDFAKLLYVMVCCGVCRIPCLPVGCCYGMITSSMASSMGQMGGVTERTSCCELTRQETQSVYFGCGAFFANCAYSLGFKSAQVGWYLTCCCCLYCNGAGCCSSDEQPTSLYYREYKNPRAMCFCPDEEATDRYKFYSCDDLLWSLPCTKPASQRMLIADSEYVCITDDDSVNMTLYGSNN